MNLPAQHPEMLQVVETPAAAAQVVWREQAPAEHCGHACGRHRNCLLCYAGEIWEPFWKYTMTQPVEMDTARGWVPILAPLH